MCELSEKLKNLDVSSELFKDIQFYVSGDVPGEIIQILNRGGADQSKYFSDFVTHLICGNNPEETDLIDATDVYEVPALNPDWVYMCAKLNRIIGIKPYLYNRPRLFNSKVFCISKLKSDLETLWALITYNGGKVQLHLDKKCDYLVTGGTNSAKYEKALNYGRISIVTPDWVLESLRAKELAQVELFHPRLIRWPQQQHQQQTVQNIQQQQHVQVLHQSSTTAITGFEEMENESRNNEKKIENDASSTQELLEKLKQRMPWNLPEQQQQTQVQTQNQSLNQTVLSKEIVPPNVVAPSFQSKIEQQLQQQQNPNSQQQQQQQNRILNHQMMQKLQLAQQQQQQNSSKFTNIPQQMTPEQQQMVQNALQQAQQNIHTQRMNQQNQNNNNMLNLQQQQQQNLNFQQQQQQQQTLLQQNQQQQQQNTVVATQQTRAVLHHQVQGNVFQQNIGGVNRMVRPNLQQIRGQIGNNQIQQQLLQQQQQRLNLQQQQRPQLSLQQQQMLQLQLQQQQQQQGQARQLLEQKNQQQQQQQVGMNQQNLVQNPQGLVQNQQNMVQNQPNLVQNQQQPQLNQVLLQNRVQQMNQQQKLAVQNHQIQLLAQRQAQLNQQRLNQQQQQMAPDQIQLINQNQQQQVQLNQNRLINQNQQLKMVQQQQQQNQMINQNLMEHHEQNQSVNLLNQNEQTQQMAPQTQNMLDNSNLLQNATVAPQQVQVQVQQQQQQVNPNLINQQQRQLINQHQNNQINQLVTSSTNQFNVQQVQQVANQNVQNVQQPNQIGQIRQVMQFNQNQPQQGIMTNFNQQNVQVQEAQNVQNVQNPNFQQLLNQNQFGQQQQGQQTIVRPHLQPQQQQMWAAQQQQQQQQQQQVVQPIQQQQIQLQPRQQTLNVQGQRVQWAPAQGQGLPQGPQRQFIQLDAQTHNQLQKMPPEQQALFVQKLQQKQRALLLKQAQQRGGGHILIRGSVPPGLSPQQQMAWLQQQAKNQGLVIPNNLQQHTINNAANQPNPSIGPPQGPGPVGMSANIQQTPGLSPIQNNPNLDPNNQMKLKQLRLQQFPIQQQQVQKTPVAPIQTVPQPQTNLIRTQAATGGDGAPIAPPIQDAVVGQNPLIVNPKTKTALANMLSIRLQSGGTSVGNSATGGATGNVVGEVIPEPSAAGTLRLMTAQHNASLNANARPNLDLLAIQQRRAINGPNGEIIRPPMTAQSVPTPQSEPPQLQFSPRATVPLQHRPGPFYGHNPNLKLPPDLYFLGCVFVVVEVDEYLNENMPNWVEKIEKHGGEVEKQYCNRVTHVLCETQRHGVVMQALRDFKRCVTLYWFADIMRKRQLLPPWTALHVPTIYLDTTPCSKHLIALSGFTGQDRGRIKQMINYTGAKYTCYFSKHNTLLISAKQEGPKFNYAKKWGIPVVNIQWLTDVMLGNFVAMNQMENLVYQQFTDPPNFSFDPKLCPNLMHGWKMPINISQETYERVKRSASPVQVSKKPKLSKIEKMDEDNNNDENVPVNPQFNILFSNIVPENCTELEQIVRKLGGSLSKDYTKCTHLVMETLNRTNKLLFCVPRNVPIVPKTWLLDSQAANRFLDPSKYTFQDVEKFNKEYGCDFEALMRVEKRNQLFLGKSFWVTPSVFPKQKVVVELIESCGGVIEKVRRTSAQIEVTNQTAPYSYFIITHEDDIHLTADLLRNKKEKIKFICNTELIFHAIMTQKIEVEPWAIKVIL